VFQIFNPIGITFSVVLDRRFHQLSPQSGRARRFGHADLEGPAHLHRPERYSTGNGQLDAPTGGDHRGSRNPAGRITPESRQRGPECAFTPKSLSMNGFGRIMPGRAVTAEAAAAINSRKGFLKKGTTYIRAGGESEIHASRRALSSGTGGQMTAPGWRDLQVLAYRWSRL
jgi:hypothetical protein